MHDYYFAASLFTHAEKEFNFRGAVVVESLGFKVFLPQRDNKHPEGGHLCYLDNLENLQSSRNIIAIVDGPDVDSGTSWEVGYFASMIHYGIKPDGDIYLVRTDFRECADGAFGVNLMISESITIPVIFRSLDELFTHLVSFKVELNKGEK